MRYIDCVNKKAVLVLLLLQGLVSILHVVVPFVLHTCSTTCNNLESVVGVHIN